MSQKISSDFKLGIIGGGQLGKMLIQAASRWDITTYVLDPDENCSAANLCTKYFKGSFKKYDDVYQFAQEVDLVTFEIEHVNIDALNQLTKEGKIVHPSSKALAIIQDKGLQKEFYANNNFPTAAFKLYQTKEEVLKAIDNKEIAYPFVQKSRKEGYDGRGVVVIKSAAENDKIFDTPSVIEEAINIEKELAVIVARNNKNEITSFPTVEMEFSAEANLVEQLVCPSAISNEVEEKAQQIAKKIIAALDMVGILAVELFLTKTGEVIVNEVAPRPHNSGHHTIESCYTSQFEQHLRAILDFPLGSTKLIQPSIMLNILGEADAMGKITYEGINECMRMEGVNLHIYGKKDVKPFRKMGHVTILGENIEAARTKAAQVKKVLKAKSL
jgi:5-(carboxyamino)imidazole ribonucleotide synthase